MMTRLMNIKLRNTKSFTFIARNAAPRIKNSSTKRTEPGTGTGAPPNPE